MKMYAFKRLWLKIVSDTWRNVANICQKRLTWQYIWYHFSVIAYWHCLIETVTKEEKCVRGCKSIERPHLKFCRLTVFFLRFSTCNAFVQKQPVIQKQQLKLGATLNYVASGYFPQTGIVFFRFRVKIKRFLVILW